LDRTEFAPLPVFEAPYYEDYPEVTPYSVQEVENAPVRYADLRDMPPREELAPAPSYPSPSYPPPPTGMMMPSGARNFERAPPPPPPPPSMPAMSYQDYLDRYPAPAQDYRYGEARPYQGYPAR
jgi:hypothetical protein